MSETKYAASDVEELVPESCGPFGDYYVPRSKVARSRELKDVLDALDQAVRP
jgi:hypothetical protein